MPCGLARCFLYTEDTLKDTSSQVAVTITHAPEHKAAIKTTHTVLGIQAGQ